MVYDGLGFEFFCSGVSDDTKYNSRSIISVVRMALGDW